MTITKSASSAATRPIGSRLVGIALPCRSEHGDQPAGGDRPQHLEHLAQRVGGVGVVDDDRERLTRVDPLHAAGHAGRDVERQRRVMDVESQRLDHRQCGERVRDVEASRQTDADGTVPARRLEVEAGAVRIRREVAGAKVGLGVDGVGDDPTARPLSEVAEAGIVGVEDGNRRLLDQARLGGAIVLDRAVELEMLAGHRRHHADVEAAVPRPLQGQPVRRGLQDDAVVAGGDHPRQQRLELEGLGRRVALGVELEVVEDAGEDGPDLAGMPAARPTASRR